MADVEMGEARASVSSARAAGEVQTEADEKAQLVAVPATRTESGAGVALGAAGVAPAVQPSQSQSQTQGQVQTGEVQTGEAREEGDHRFALDEDFHCLQKIGNMILICGRKRSYFPFHCLVGPHWPMIALTYTLIIVPTVLVLIFIAWPLHPVAFAVCMLSFLVTIIFYTLSACSDPGIVYEGDVTEETPQAVHCAKCKIYRNLRGDRHCYYCGVCVKQMDHHCPWQSKCVGGSTIRSFMVFCSAVCAHSCIVGAIVVVYFVLRLVQSTND